MFVKSKKVVVSSLCYVQCLILSYECGFVGRTGDSIFFPTDPIVWAILYNIDVNIIAHLIDVDVVGTYFCKYNAP